MSQQYKSPQLVGQTHYLREIVKDSMNREAQELPSRTQARDRAADSLPKQRNFQRSLNHNDGTYGLGLYGKKDLPVDINESLIVLAKLQEAPPYVNEPKGLSRPTLYQSKDGSFFSIVKETPRFSYDGKDILNSSSRPREILKTYVKYQDLPRLSLDSRESSTQSLKSEQQPDLFRKPMQKTSETTNRLRNQHRSSGTQIRSPSVVAKLMGLEALPSSVAQGESKTTSIRSTTLQDPSCRPTQASVQSKESNSPRWKNSASSTLPVSRLPLEPAPWKQVDGNQRYVRAAPKDMKDPVKTLNTFPSVYSEIEKRLKDLEFSHSGKDLRALKQILEAMHEKGGPRFAADPKDHGRKYNNSVPNGTLKHQNDMSYSSIKQGGNFSRNYESPIVIMKPAYASKVQDGAFIDSRSPANARAPRGHNPPRDSRENISNDIKSSRRASKSTQTLTRSAQSVKERNAASSKSSGSAIPRTYHKKPEPEKRTKPRTPPTDSGRSTKPSNKHGTSSSATSRRRRSTSSGILKSDDEMSEISNDSTNVSCHGNGNSAQSDGSILSESRTDIEVTSSDRSLEVINWRSPFTKTFHGSVSCLIEKKSTLHQSEDELSLEHPAFAPEYPSPVSVLDNILDMDDSLSPVKYEAKSIRGEELQDSGAIPSSDQYNASVKLFSDAEGSGPTSEINRKKLKNIENLVQKLQRVNSTHDEARTDYIASLCENTNPDHRYISEILLASGFLLSDVGSSLTNFQFHSSGHPINPGLFLVLEQTKASSFLQDDYPPGRTKKLRLKQKIHRKLIFDTINEVLARKLESLGPFSPPWLRSHKLARKTINAQKLLRELCLETDKLQAKKSNCRVEDDDDGLKIVLQEDLMHPYECWTDNINEVSSIVLDVERLVFKDLVDEVLIGEIPGLKNKQARRRQLFTK